MSKKAKKVSKMKDKEVLARVEALCVDLARHYDEAGDDDVSTAKCAAFDYVQAVVKAAREGEAVPDAEEAADDIALMLFNKKLNDLFSTAFGGDGDDGDGDGE